MRREFDLTYETASKRKYRWIADVGGAKFKLYIPKERFPDDVPNRIQVVIATDVLDPIMGQADLSSIVELAEQHSETVRYTPVGNSGAWTIGEPYIPASVLPQPVPKRLGIAVKRIPPSESIADK